MAFCRHSTTFSLVVLIARMVLTSAEVKLRFEGKVGNYFRREHVSSKRVSYNEKGILLSIRVFLSSKISSFLPAKRHIHPVRDTVFKQRGTFSNGTFFKKSDSIQGCILV